MPYQPPVGVGRDVRCLPATSTENYRLERQAQEADRRRGSVHQWLDLPACVRCLIGGGPHSIHTAMRQENGRCIGSVKWLLRHRMIYSGTGTSTAYFGRAQAVVKLITIICRHDYCLPRGARPARFTA